MKLYIGVTDNDWFRYLRSLSGVEEVNFWRPGATGSFKAPKPGKLFLFKLHSPENFIVGGGFFVHFTRLPYTIAWETFREMNGAPIAEEIRRRVAKYGKSRWISIWRSTAAGERPTPGSDELSIPMAG